MQIFARALFDANVDVTVIATHYPYTDEPYVWHGIQVYPLKGNNKKYRTLFLKRKALKVLESIHEKHPVDLVHSFWLNETTKIGKSLANAFGVPLVATAMGQEMRNAKRGFKKWEEETFPIVALSEFQASALRKKGVLPTTIIPWGLDKTIEVQKDIDLICVGNLIPLKNTSYFVSLCAEVIKNIPTLNAKIVGTGPLASNLQQQIAQLGLRDHVELLGLVSYDTTLSLIAQSKVMVHTSEFEGFGMIFIEAMASSTYLISTPVGLAQTLDIPHLTGELAIDAAMIQVLLQSQHPESVFYDIKETVKQYRTIYGF